MRKLLVSHDFPEERVAGWVIYLLLLKSSQLCPDWLLHSEWARRRERWRNGDRDEELSAVPSSHYEPALIPRP